MNFRRLLAGMWVFLPAVMLRAGLPSTTQSMDDATAARGRAVRSVLLELLEQSFSHDGVWPLAMPGEHPGLSYIQPPKHRMTQSARSDRILASATVVIFESFDQHPDGVWVGYADGHLEFAPDQATLSACRDQARMAEKGSAKVDGMKGAPAASGELTLRVVDGDGKAVSGALAGIYTNFGDNDPEHPRVDFADGKPRASDGDGEIVLSATKVFDAKFINEPAAPIFIIHEGRGLVAQVQVQRSDFVAGGAGKMREIKLVAGCHVTARLTGIDLPDSGREIGNIESIAFYPGDLARYTHACSMREAAAEHLFPPGEYGMQIEGPGTRPVYRFIEVAAGQRSISLRIDLPPSTVTGLTGRPAPELVRIKGWKNTEPLTIASLRGHPVVIDFWGVWCNPCCEQMADLMKLSDDYKGLGVVVIAIHDDSVASIAEMERRLIPIRARLWGNRDIPFAVALDGGGETRIRYSAARERGATTAAYGITSFPTTILIGPDGKVVGNFRADSAKDRAELDRLLAASGR